MQYATLIAALAIGAPAMAMPAPAFATEGKFSLSQQSHGVVLKSGPIAYKKALNKYKAAVPTHVASAADAAQSGSVTASPEQYDSSYLVPVTIGSQTVHLDFDTGSADLWVFSTELPSSESSGHTLYDPSSATPLSGATWDISYGDGSGASGNVYSDKVVVGPVTATSQAVEAATSVSSEFTQQTDNDGLLGLAFSSINTVSPTKQTTFFDTVSSTLAQPLFAAYLRAGQAGSYDFGYIDDSKYTGSLNTVDVDSSNGFWAFDAGDASAGGNSLGSLGSSIADTGTSLILIDDSIVSAYYSNVDGASNSQSAGGYVFDCSATLPDFTISINGQDATVPGSYISYAPNGDGTCYGGIQSSSGIGFNILGDVFLKSQYVVFSSDGPSLSFAQQA